VGEFAGLWDGPAAGRRRACLEERRDQTLLRLLLRLLRLRLDIAWSRRRRQQLHIGNRRNRTLGRRVCRGDGRQDLRRGKRGQSRGRQHREALTVGYSGYYAVEVCSFEVRIIILHAEDFSCVRGLSTRSFARRQGLCHTFVVAVTEQFQRSLLPPAWLPVANPFSHAVFKSAPFRGFVFLVLFRRTCTPASDDGRPSCQG